MLILTRKIGESLIINDNVTITILGVKGTQIKIGINAPKNIAVYREEIFKKLKIKNDITIENKEEKIY